MPDSRGLVAGRYRLVSQIGSGGMGRVWLAHDEVLHRDVAIKEVLLPAGQSDAERQDLLERTLREARAAGRLSHPNVIAVYDVVMFDERPWIVMEYVPSRSLYQVVRDDGPLPVMRVAEIGLLLLAALRAAHRAGVWHRDVKPGNVLLARSGRVVLTDFGLATFDGDGGVTRSGLILGSAQYIAPERARDGASGPESDMWSLGATLYAAVEGRSPYARESPMATLTALATAPPDPPRRAGALRPVLIGLLRKNPRHRLNAVEAERMLRRVVDGEGRVRGRSPRGRERVTAPVPAAAPGAAVPAGVARSLVLPPPAPADVRAATREAPRAHPRRRWTWLAGLVVLGLAGGVVALVTVPRTGGGAALGPRPSSRADAAVTPTRAGPSLSPAMGVQACAGAPDGSGVTVTGVTRPPAVTYAALEHWVYYLDPSGFHIMVPGFWRVWRDGSLLCLRDPTSMRMAAVLSEGPRPGRTLDLLAEDEGPWVTAAGLAGYERLRLATRPGTGRDLASELEYRYIAGGTPLRGTNLLRRDHGRAFLVCYLATDTYWPTELAFMNPIQISFGLDF